MILGRGTVLWHECGCLPLGGLVPTRPWSAAMAGGHQLARTRLPRYRHRPRTVPPDDEPGIAPRPVPEHVDALLNHHHGVPWPAHQKKGTKPRRTVTEPPIRRLKGE